MCTNQWKRLTEKDQLRIVLTACIVVGRPGVINLGLVLVEIQYEYFFIDTDNNFTTRKNTLQPTNNSNFLFSKKIARQLQYLYSYIPQTTRGRTEEAPKRLQNVCSVHEVESWVITVTPNESSVYWAWFSGTQNQTLTEHVWTLILIYLVTEHIFRKWLKTIALWVDCSPCI